MKLNAHYILFCILTCLSQAAVTQIPYLSHYTVDEGLPSSNIYRVIQDDKGYVWIATDLGIARFDGYHFKNYSYTDGLVNNDVWGFEKDEKGRLWLKTFNSIIYYDIDTDQFQNIDNSIGINISQVTNHFFDNKDNHFVSISGEHRSEVFNISKEGDISLFAKLPADMWNHLSEDELGNNYFFCMQKEGVCKIIKVDPVGYQSTVKIISDNLPEVNSFSNYIVSLGKNEYLFFNADNFYLFNDRTFSLEIIPLNNVLKEDTEGLVLEAINEVGDDLVLITNKGYKTINKDLVPVDKYKFLNNYNVNSVYQDKDGNKWICTTNGLYLFANNTRNSKNYYVSNVEKENDIKSLTYQEASKTLFLGTGNGALFVLEKEKFREIEFNKFVGKTRQKIEHLLFDDDGDLIMLGNFGLIILKEKELNNHRIKLGQSKIGLMDYSGERSAHYDHIIKNVSITEENKLLLSTHMAVPIIRKNKNEDFYNLPIGRAYAAIMDGRGDVWAGNKKGIGRYLMKEKKYQNPSELNVLQKPINDLEFDNNKNIWASTNGFGIYRYSLTNEKIETIAELKNINTKSIIIDKENIVWVCTNKGLYRISDITSDPFEYEIENLTTKNGLLSNETNDLIVVDSLVYVATKKGLSVFPYSYESTPKDGAKFYFTKITVDNKDEKEIKKKYELKHSENNININYLCLSYENIGDITYEYKMEGFQDDWFKTKDIKKEFSFLPPGNYTFKIKAFDIRSQQIANGEIEFIIKYPWWSALWIRLLGILFIAGISFLIYRWYFENKKKKYELEVQMEKRMVELKLEALQSQMNPHFIFNALQAIKGFLIEDEKGEATEYLVEFSRLIRLFLESSKERYISLEEEIELLGLYIKLENLRFSDAFDYHFEIEEDLDIDAIEIPSMLLQPFVENAINHGLIHKENKGILSIRIFLENDELICIIEDNGIGRKEAREIRQKSFKNYKSRGMGLVKDRMEAINNLENQKFEYQITDLYDINGEAKGTKVRIRIPI